MVITVLSQAQSIDSEQSKVYFNVMNRGANETVTDKIKNKKRMGIRKEINCIEIILRHWHFTIDGNFNFKSN